MLGDLRHRQRFRAGHVVALALVSSVVQQRKCDFSVVFDID